ncbi:glycogen debranching enzyme [Arthrobacter sp. V1I9]|nr:glycogen debranching enzyme [Arthrobacter sp. V1I9]
MTLFGRDSLWASKMASGVDPSSALGILQTLADRQGSVVDPESEEEPGKILHEVRSGVSSGLALGCRSAYYGSVDTTPLLGSTLGSVSRWGFARDTIAALLPHADRALDSIRNYGDRTLTESSNTSVSTIRASPTKGGRTLTWTTTLVKPRSARVQAERGEEADGLDGS